MARLKLHVSIPEMLCDQVNSKTHLAALVNGIETGTTRGQCRGTRVAADIASEGTALAPPPRVADGCFGGCGVADGGAAGCVTTLVQLVVCRVQQGKGL